MLCILTIAVAHELRNSAKDQNELCWYHCMKNWGFAQNNTSGKCEKICCYLFSTNLEKLILHAVVTAHELWKYSFQEVFHHRAILRSCQNN